jgi:hypothetical protein
MEIVIQIITSSIAYVLCSLAKELTNMASYDLQVCKERGCQVLH